jgi:hypothetical protein
VLWYGESIRTFSVDYVAINLNIRKLHAERIAPWRL